MFDKIISLIKRNKVRIKNPDNVYIPKYLRNSIDRDFYQETANKLAKSGKLEWTKSEPTLNGWNFSFAFMYPPIVNIGK